MCNKSNNFMTNSQNFGLTLYSLFHFTDHIFETVEAAKDAGIKDDCK